MNSITNQRYSKTKTDNVVENVSFDFLHTNGDKAYIDYAVNPSFMKAGAEFVDQEGSCYHSHRNKHLIPKAEETEPSIITEVHT